MSKEQDREEILRLVADYAKKYHVKKEYKEGEHISYASRVYDGEEMCNLVDAALEFWLTSGRFTEIFEREFAKYLGVKHVSVVNSGSSANLLAFMALTSPLLKDRMIQRGDEVITVAAGFPTTITPMLQFGAIPVFVDINPSQYNINIEEMKKALSSKTKAVFIAHTLGNPFDLQAVKDFCVDNGLWLIEDNCDALGAEFVVDGVNCKTGTVGDLGTSSFYPAHQMTMGEGGAVYTNNPLLDRIVKSYRDWGRDCVCPPGNDNTCHHRFDGKYGELPEGYDHKYVYSHFGYNLKATDMQAAIGCAQLKKLPGFVEKRREHFKMLYEGLVGIGDKADLPVVIEGANPCWFGFPITCHDGIDKNKVVDFIEKKGVQTRMLFAGNMVKQPCFDYIRGDENQYKVVGDLSVTDNVMKKTFWVGVYPGLTDEQIRYMIKTILEAFE